MSAAAQPGEDPLLRGFYTMAEAARVLRMANPQRVRRWVTGSLDREPVIARDYEPGPHGQDVSFLDLMEIRFVEYFRHKGLSLQYLRRVAVRLRERTGSRHPFALSRAVYYTDRRRVFEEEAGQRFAEVLSGQLEMYETIEQSLARGVSFDPATSLASAWQPFPTTFPAVVLDPRLAFGQPVVARSGVPTRVLAQQYKAEGANPDRVAAAWNLDPAEVEEAAAFEDRLSRENSNG